MNATVETDLLDYSLTRLAEHLVPNQPIRVEEVDPGEFRERAIDGYLHFGEKQVPYRIKANSEIREIRNQVLEDRATVVYIVPYMDRKARAICQEHHINYLDSTGNCRLIFDNFVAVVERDGVPPGRPLTLGRGFQANGIKLLHYFYERPELLQASYRDLSTATGISTGAISGILEDLRAEGLYENRKKGNRLRRGRFLVERWAYAYLDRIRPKLHRATLRELGDGALEEIEKTGKRDGVAVGGQHAATTRSGYLISPDFVLYTDLRLAALFEDYHLAPVSKKNEHHTYRDVYHVFPPLPERTVATNKPALPIVGDLIIYADLLGSHDARVVEAANHLLDNEIQDHFRQCGLWS